MADMQFHAIGGLPTITIKQNKAKYTLTNIRILCTYAVRAFRYVSENAPANPYELITVKFSKYISEEEVGIVSDILLGISVDVKRKGCYESYAVVTRTSWYKEDNGNYEMKVRLRPEFSEYVHKLSAERAVLTYEDLMIRYADEEHERTLAEAKAAVKYE